MKNIRTLLEELDQESYEILSNPGADRKSFASGIKYAISAVRKNLSENKMILNPEQFVTTLVQERFAETGEDNLLSEFQLGVTRALNALEGWSPTRYLFIEIETLDGEIGYTERVLHTYTGDHDPEEEGENYASQFWGGWGGRSVYDEEEGTWTYEGDYRIVSLSKVKELTKDQYDLMHKIIY